MFGLFTSEKQRARKDAHNWLHLARKIQHFRRDQMPAAEMQALQKAENELRNRLKDDSDAAKIKLNIEVLESCLRKSGGTYYPKSSIVDNVEFFFVALILFLGIRTFVVQPFKIPTNSMWPTYHGLTWEVFDEREEEPNGLMQGFRFAALGASARRVDTPVSGEVRIPWAGQMVHREVPRRRWLVLPGRALRYSLYVDSTEVSVTVPLDFRFENLVIDAFFDGDPAAFNAAREQAEFERRRSGNRYISANEPLLIATGRKLRAGDRVLSFDILTGDQLFVDRLSYHFVRPRVGDGFVFRTIHIPWVEQGARTKFVDRYYIKRLVGTPGDELEVQEPVLYRNGAPITGASAFEKNAHRESPFRGYQAAERLAPDRIVHVEPDSYFAMGDNSYNSSDSRYWGFVPAQDVVGRPLFVYYPFTARWGPAR